MARLRPSQLTVQTPRPAARKDGAAFYIVPPALVAIAFAFCALVPRGLPAPAPTPAVASNAKPAASPAKPAPAKPAPTPAKETPVATAPRDLNDDLPEYAIPEGRENLLEGLELATVSVGKEDMPAVNALDGSCDNDRHVAVAMPDTKGEAWWQVDAPEGDPLTGDCVVIYGGGSASPAGKLIGGFRVDLTLADGNMLSRDFCVDGFALEGYESWNLGEERQVSSLRVTARQSGQPVVLREVQLIGAASADDEEDEGEEEEEELDA